MHVLKVSAFFAIMALSSGLAAGDESGLPPSQENVASEQAVPAGERALPFYDTAFVALVDGTTQHYVLVPPENVADGSPRAMVRLGPQRFPNPADLMIPQKVVFPRTAPKECNRLGSKKGTF